MNTAGAVRNPVLPGFDPDPSVGEGYHIATSAIEWYPGIRIHRGTGGGRAAVAPVLDARLISDEAGRGERASFTGAFVAVAAFGTSGEGNAADFGYFAYEPIVGP